MKWQRISERENPFLRNSLMYESIALDFPKEFLRDHPDLMTIRSGRTYVHYMNQVSYNDLACHIKELSAADRSFFVDTRHRAESVFHEIDQVLSKIRNPNVTSNKELLEAMRTYFHLYRRAYTSYLICVGASAFEDDNSAESKAAIQAMAEIRLFCRISFEASSDKFYPFLLATAQRTGFLVDELEFLSPGEIEGLLSADQIDVKSLYNNRQQCVFIHTHGNFVLHENMSVIVHDDESRPNSRFFREFNATQILRGQGAFLGKHRGKVKIIHALDDMQYIEQDGILVARMTTPDIFASAFARIGGIITDEGGITCHAAIISREYEIPCIVGTKIATEVLKDGDEVELDAGTGVVRVLKC